MLKNHLTIAIRNLFKNKLFSAINILGLSLGMACCFLIVLFLQHEFSYDNFHTKADRIYRLNYGADFARDGMIIASCPPVLAPLLAENVSEIEKTARMFRRNISISTKDANGSAINEFEVENNFFCDSTILDILTFDFVQGNPKTALDAPGSVVITEEMSAQLFGTADGLGKTLYFEDTHNFKVTGVVKKFPENAHLEFNLLVPYADMYNIMPEQPQQFARRNLAGNWIISHSFTYALLEEGADINAVNAKMPAFLKRFGNPDYSEKQSFTLFPVTDLHIKSPAQSEPKPTSNLSFLYIFLGIGFVTLLIACINFVNFSTAGSLSRAKEVGVRKVLGAGKRSIALQFLGESMILSFIAFIFSLVLVQAGLPFLNDVTNRNIDFVFIENIGSVALFFGIFIIAGLVAGSYPAFFVTRFKPISILRGTGFSNVPKGAALRKVLITVQFVASIALIAATLGIYKQLQFLLSQPMGFQTNQIINVPLFSPNLNTIFGGIDGSMRQKLNVFEEELLQNPKISAVTLSNAVPSQGSVRRQMTSDKVPTEDNFFIGCYAVDYDFMETYDLEIIAGRAFDKSYGTDHTSAFVINEMAVKALKFDSSAAAIGESVEREGKPGTIVGVVKDFHFQDLRAEIFPLSLDVDAAIFNTFSMKVNATDMPATLAFVENKWKEFFPQKVFEYTFLDNTIEDLYQAETGLGKMIGYFAFLAILISCFGLYGLVAFAALQKTKEIGIRKVLGASIPNILVMLSKEFIVLILIAGALAIPAAYYWLNSWLADYHYAIEIGAWLALIPIATVLAIALVTISFQVIKAALGNPVEALKCE
ncbi:MAG: putative ABC transport system permease protein [Saprospiraceae bacterium]|jgi:putative ABC transport system permease protein